MTRTHIDAHPWQGQASPGGRYSMQRRPLSQEAGGQKDTGTWGGGHPFDLEAHRIPPGKANFPLHEHAAQWEAYYILGGTGQLRTPQGHHDIGPGDYLVCPPGEAHQLVNTGQAELLYLVIADHPQADVIRYPDSGKWLIKPQRKVFEMKEVPYFQGEE